MSGFGHHHSDEALARYRALSVDQRLEWLEAARHMTADFLPASRLRAWQKTRGDTAYTVPRTQMLALWARFQAALDAGLEGVTRFASELRVEGFAANQVLELIEDYGDWIKVRTGWRPGDHAVWQAALEQLRV